CAASQTRRHVLDVLMAEPGCNLVRICAFFPAIRALNDMYWMFEQTEFVLPKRTRAEHWPLNNPN
ncbi:MAG: hypothetical protein H0T21_06695, partial [Gemmatimonadaceae bacterium]|nr:hypothetical protein [Gemmatimonadaceae bacterium]